MGDLADFRFLSRDFDCLSRDLDSGFSWTEIVDFGSTTVFDDLPGFIRFFGSIIEGRSHYAICWEGRDLFIILLSIVLDYWCCKNELS